MGRPATKPKKLRDGFYIEIKNKNQKSGGIKIHRDNIKELVIAIQEYEKTKEVTVLGKLENGKMKPIDVAQLA